jgi:hypothetical protein
MVVVGSTTSDTDWEPFLVVCLFLCLSAYVASYVAVGRAWRSGGQPVDVPPSPDIHGEPPVLWIALLLNTLGGCGLFYTDPRSPRRALYPSVILPALFCTIAIPSRFSPSEEVIAFSAESWFVLFLFLVACGYVASYVEIVRAVRRRPRQPDRLS